jgi:CRP/FNR family cyclic AMP-dependent transcriptional regulator
LIEDDDGRRDDHRLPQLWDFFGEMGLFEKDGTKERSAWYAKTECEVADELRQKFQVNSPNRAQTFFTPGYRWSVTAQYHAQSGRPGLSRCHWSSCPHLLDLCKQPDAIPHPDGMQIATACQGNWPHRRLPCEMVGRVLKALRARFGQRQG